jgi:mRNA-degrading endonuclease YafQ of YafQ-DinJ toxin-antitoxin module
MFEIIFTAKYSKKSRSFLKIHPDLLAPYKKTILLLKNNLYHPSLRLHKLKGRSNHYQSVSINMQYRIIINFIILYDKMILIDIGDRSLYGYCFEIDTKIYLL